MDITIIVVAMILVFVLAYVIFFEDLLWTIFFAQIMSSALIAWVFDRFMTRYFHEYNYPN